MRVIKPYSPIAWFVVLSTSFGGPKTGIKSTQVYPEHPRTSYVGAEADDWPTLSLNIKTTAREGKLLYNRRHINDLVQTLKGQQDRHSWKYNVLGT